MRVRQEVQALLRVTSNRISLDSLVVAGGNFPALTLNGEPWRLVTSMFLHGGIVHLVMNMACLIAAGQNVEYAFGRRSFLAIYLCAGLVGSIFSAARAEMVVSVGASGAVFGIFGAHFAYLLTHRDQLAPDARGTQLKNLAIFMGINLVGGLAGKGIDVLAHVGGLVTGFMIAFMAERRLDVTESARADAVRLKRVLVGSLLALAVVGVGLVVLPNAESEVVAQFQSKMERFAVSESVLIDKQNSFFQRSDATLEEAVKLVDDELLPGWRALAADVGEISGLPSELQPRHRAIMDYIDARVAQVESLSVLAKLDPATAEFAQAGATVKLRSEEAEAALSALKRMVEQP